MMSISFTQHKHISTFLLLMLFSFSAWSQDQSPLQTTLRYLENHQKELKLEAEDFKDFVVSDLYYSSQSDATMIYLNQRFNGIKIQNAIFNAAVNQEGTLVHYGNKFIVDIANKVNTSSPSLTAEEAVLSAFEKLQISNASSISQKERISSQRFIFHQGNFSNSDIPVQLQYIMFGKAVRLVWEVQIDMINAADYWSVQVDATNGRILDQKNLVIKCAFGDLPYHNHDATCRSLDNVKIVSSSSKKTTAMNAPVLLGGSYNVFAEKDANGNLHPHESPSHGNRNLLTDVEHPTASPFGWHDTNGFTGADFTITRGNNVHAYLDVGGTGIPQGDEPDGGNALIFDYPLVTTNEPETFEEAAVTNAFFMVNYLHDFAYLNGFDESSGNFQANNYGNGGQGNDFVNVEVHDGSGINNADMLTPQDGSNGRMQMYLWNAGTENLLTVEAPVDVAGTYSVSHPDWGTMITDVPITGEVVLPDDGTDNPTFACQALINDSEMQGKVALIDRGGCEFGLKVINAQEAGAIGAIICNFEDDLINMGPGLVGDNATIPVVSMSSPDCQTIRGFIGNGLTISFVEPPGSTGPDNVSGALDNGVIAHEFAHGISNRLVGGPNNPGCLSNQEQMGEGISDFFTLVSTVKPGDIGDMKKGIGTFVNREDTDGRGIRRYPYSTDMAINPVTYKDIVGEAQHARGTIWASALWDMYWLLVEEYGFDADYFEGVGGNNIAVKLAIEGMKLTSCSPGYIEARDAILAADELMYSGANQCIIWEAFAKRGMGIHADQVNEFDTSDGFEDFTTPGECAKDVRMSKTVSETVVAGELIDVTIEATNFKDETITGVVITDEIPAGTTVVPGSTGTVSGNTISFNVGEMTSMEDISITYQLETDPNIFSVTSFLDDIENGDSNWDVENILGNNIWQAVDNGLSNSGDFSLFVPNNPGENEQTVFLFESREVVGTQPVLRFYHWYETQTAVDGGIVEISTDGGASWQQTGDKMFRNGYQRVLSYQTFVLPFLSAFSGRSNLDGSDDFRATYIDLSEFVGEDIQVRFRFGANTLDADVWGNVQDNFVGWYVDDVEIMDMKNYEGEACLTTNEGDNICDAGIARGTIVEPSGFVNTNTPAGQDMEIKIFPNPADNILNLQVRNNQSEDADIQILTVDGKEMLRRSFRTINGLEILNLNIATLPTGMYFLRVSTTNSVVVKKVTVE